MVDSAILDGKRSGQAQVFVDGVEDGAEVAFVGGREGAVEEEGDDHDREG